MGSWQVMNPPTTFHRRNPEQVLRVLSQQHGRGLPRSTQGWCAVALARNSVKHAAAMQSIIAHGFAKDEADADELIREYENE